MYVKLCRQSLYIDNHICNWFPGPRDGDPLGPEILEVSWHEHLLFFSNASDRVFHKLKHQRNSLGSCEIRVGFMD